jgi:hypothetical protein
MALRNEFARALRIAALGGVGIALFGCQSFQEATGAAKLAPDEFTVITKAPLIMPPDYNLHPPQPGALDRNQGDPDDEARAALFAQQDPQAAAAALGPNYSDGEKALLAKSGGATADPAVRQDISSDSGYSDQGDAFAQKVLYPQGAPAQPAAAATPPLAPPQVRGTTTQ